MRWIVVAIVAASVSAPASSDVLTLSPSRDNTLFEDAEGDTSNGAGPALFVGQNGEGRIRRALLWFDFTGRVPRGARIDSVVLVLQVSNAPDAIPRRIAWHRLQADWGEGWSRATGGSGAPATHQDATWLHRFHPAQVWSEPGGDFELNASSIQLVAGSGAYGWRDAALTADVAGWVARPDTNHGWIAIGDEIALHSARRFESREAAVPADRPALTIHFTQASAANAATWGSVKARYRRGEP